MVLAIVPGLFLPLVGVYGALDLSVGENTALTVTTFVVTPIWTLVLLAFTTAFPAAVYTDLRRSKVGSAGDVAQVFT